MDIDLMLGVLFFIQVSVLYYVKRRKGKGRGFRRWWVRELNEIPQRGRFGHHSSLFNFLLSNDREKFAEYTRMSPKQFTKLLELLSPFLRKKSRRKPLSPSLRLALTLSYLSQGHSIRSQAWNFRVGRSTAYKIVPETCRAICRALMPVYLPPMTRDKWSDVADGFMVDWQFPNCLGAVDGKHIRMKAPPKSGSQWWCYKGHFSLVLMAACDSKYRFTWMDVGQYGSISDGGVWNNTNFAQNLENNVARLPPAKPLPNSVESTNYAFVGDEAFPLKKYLLRPYSRNHLGDAERVFNYRLSRARRTIENAFGILTSRWQIFNSTIGHVPENSSEIVKATVCLHNFLMYAEEELPHQQRVYCPPDYTDVETASHDVAYGSWRWREEAQLQSLQQLGHNNPTRSAADQRDLLRDCFVSAVGESQAPWQYALAFKGLNVNIPLYRYM